MRMRGSSLASSMGCYLVLIVLVTLSTHGRVTVMGQSGNKMTKLKIAVPPKDGFTQFVNIIPDPTTGAQIFGGFAIEVFNQAVNATADFQSTSFEFIPFARSDGTMNGSYDNMMEAVNNKEYDGAVGDITIRYSRLQWVDFTIAYTDTGISMLIPTRQKQNENLAKSLNSLTQEMMIGTFVLLFLSILVFLCSDILNFLFGPRKDNTVWTSQLGQGVNQKARIEKDAWKRDILGTVKSTRLMMLLWFVILVFLITYYATSLISLLQRQQSIAPIKSLEQIIRTGENVGYNRGSWTFNALKDAGIAEKRLFHYDDEDDLLNLFSKGTNEGGITVAIDDTHTLSVVYAQHCSNYTLLPFTDLHASGYGFAFPKGSKLVQELSNGIIKLVDNGELEKIKARTIGEPGTCDVDPTLDNISDIVTLNVLRTFKACAIVSVGLLAVIYAVSIISSNRHCLRFWFP